MPESTIAIVGASGAGLAVVPHSDESPLSCTQSWPLVYAGVTLPERPTGAS
jgi:hypothetical protein